MKDNNFKKNNSITIDSDNPVSSKIRFDGLRLHPDLKSNLEELGFHNLTPIQTLSLPKIIEGDDLIAQAKTGSGKTAAFGLGILNKLDVKKFKVQSLTLCPTRELAVATNRHLQGAVRREDELVDLVALQDLHQEPLSKIKRLWI